MTAPAVLVKQRGDEARIDHRVGIRVIATLSRGFFGVASSPPPLVVALACLPGTVTAAKVSTCTPVVAAAIVSGAALYRRLKAGDFPLRFSQLALDLGVRRAPQCLKLGPDDRQDRVGVGRGVCGGICRLEPAAVAALARRGIRTGRG